ncbi:MAG: Flp pilus assembly protein CpaB [Acidobacteria bacterium]|nr:Flp pilus assembly protein CpaB [Acidobacteriota bacterium]
MNRRFLLVLGLSVVLALGVSAVFYQFSSSAGARFQAGVAMKNVVAASNPLSLGATIKSTDLKMIRWPADSIPPGSYARIEDVVDRVAVGSILPNEPIVEGRLAERGSGMGLSPMIPTGMRAVSVRVNDVIGVAGFVLPGARVDVLVTGVPRGQESVTGPVTRTVLSNTLVLSAGKNIQPDAKGQPENVPVVTLLVSPADAEVLTLASSEGKIQLALRNNIDPGRSTSGGAASAQLFSGNWDRPQPAAKPRPRLVTVKLPLPQKVPPPPPPPQIEMIRGGQKTIEVIPTKAR